MRGRLFNDTQSVLGSPLRNLVSILAFVGVVAVLSTFAYMAAGWSFEEASYMVVLTIYTVGYGEVRPIDVRNTLIATRAVQTRADLLGASRVL